MGKFQSMHKYFVVFLALVVCHESLLTHGRKINPLNSEKKVDTPMLPYEGASFEESGADTNAFRPTTPGSSPGVGHRKYAQDKAVKAMVVVQSPDVKVFVTEGSKDDFRPTSPGSSPGVGHAQQNKNGQLY